MIGLRKVSNLKRYIRLCVILLICAVGWPGAVRAEGRFEALCAESAAAPSDTVAWLEIPEAGFCQPVMQHAQDDSFYSAHDAAGAESRYGALYTQKAYSRRDFTDPVTIIYGSSLAEGAPLRDLQQTYSGRFEECRRMLLHLPQETLEYEVFAAVPYSSVHILHYYDFAVERRYEGFFDSVFSTRLLGMHLDEARRPGFGDRVLILSTGLRGDGTQRYLVMARLIAE